MSTEEQNDKLRKVAWSELFPWLILARCFRIAIQLRLLLLGAVGIFFTIGGWAILGLIFSANSQVEKQTEGYGTYPWKAVTEELGDKPRGLTGEVEPAVKPSLLTRANRPDWLTFARWQGPFWAAWEPLWSTWEQLSRPFRGVFDWKTNHLADRVKPAAAAAEAGTEAAPPETGANDVWGWIVWVAFLLLCGLWALAVWAFFGGAISRAASIELATGDRAKLFRSLGFAASKWASYFAAPLIPLVGAFLVAVPLALGGLLLYWGGVGTFLAGLGWPLALLGGFLMALLLLGLVFGWPLFWGNLSTEGVDSFDAVGRTYDYVYHRPLNYLFYAIVAALIGALGWLVVANFFEGIVGATYWGVSWGATEKEIALVRDPGSPLGPVETAGAWLVRFWVQCVKFLGVGFLYSYIWVAGSAIYLLLRRDVDATEMDEVLPEEEPEQQPAPTPETKPEAAGAPVVGETPEVKPAEPPPPPQGEPPQPPPA
jgi:hypothetical protein